MSTVDSRPQLSSSELRCSPHTTYYTNFFVLRTAVTAEIGFFENKQLTLNCRYPSTKFMRITFHTISSQVEAVLKKYGVNHVGNLWLGEVLFLQVGFSSEHSLRTFLHSQQEVQREVGLLFSARLREGQPSTASASPVSHGFPVEVEADLFLVLPDAEDKTRAVSLKNCSSCLALWKESEKFDFVALFRTLKVKAEVATVKEELSVNVLVSELSDVVEWFHFGLYLEVPQSELLTVEADHRGQTKRCRTETLDWWVKNGEQPTWSAVVRALFGIRMRGLAEKIAVKYNVALPTDTERRTLEALPLQTEADHSTVSLVAQLEKLRMENGMKSEQLQHVLDRLLLERERKMEAERKLTNSTKELMSAHKIINSLSLERMEAEKMLRLKEKELFFLQQVRVTDESKRDLESVIESKEAEIAQLRERLASAESELSQAREKMEQLKEKLQQTTKELVERSTQVHEMERAKADMERERSRADMMVMLLCASNLGLQSQLERVTSTELDTLKQAVKEKEEEIGRLSSQLEAKETEKQKLLAQVERQSQQEEDEQVQLTAEVCELKSRLIEAEDGRMRAEVEPEDLKSRKSVINQPAPHNCKAVGRGLQYGETNQIAEFQVHLTDANGEPCVERQEVRVELKSLVDGHITQAEVSHQTRSVGSYSVSYQPSIRGRHELSVLVNDVAVRGSPFRVYVQQPPQLMGQPVRVIRGLSRPYRATLSSSGQLIVTECFSGRISVFDGQSELVHRINSLGPWYSRVKLDPTGVAIDDSGTMYVCDGNAHKLFKVSSTGKVLKSVGGRGSGPRQFDWPDGIALKDNRLYICDRYNHRIQIFSCDLNFISSFGSHGSGEGEFSLPRDIAFDQEGNVYVVDDGSHCVQIVLPSGTFLRTFGKLGRGSGELNGPVGIHVDHNIVYITEWDNHRISTFTTSGEFITSFGSYGNEEGKFYQPCGITMDCDGFLYVCDRFNVRIQVF